VSVPASLPAGAVITSGEALARVAATAQARDRGPACFPEDAIAALESAGLLAWGASSPVAVRPAAHEELALVRAVARADGSVGRIFDGHVNAVERLAVQAPEELRDRELAAVRARALRCGVWGGDPRPGEGPPAMVVDQGGQEVLRGVKTFCSGAGGLHRALVLARIANPPSPRPPSPPTAVWIDLTLPGTVEIDEAWYLSSGLRASVSHRVVFHDAPVLAHLGPPGALTQEPWFSRDALRTAATWAGMADSALEAALQELAARPSRGALEDAAAGRMLSAHGTIDVWIDAAAGAMDAPSDALPAISAHTRAEIAAACHRLLDEAARACGSHPFVRAGQLDRARRDLEVFLLQHRLDPILARAGAAALAERTP